jgi:hypothetical protein
MTKKCNRLRGERPKAFWGALVGGAMNLIGSAISSKSQARAIRRQIEAQKEAARTQLELANNSNLASTLNSYATATRSYNDEDDYNLKYRLGGNKRLGSNKIYITDGGNATKIGNDTYLLRGGSHEQTNETGQTGIGINVGGNEIEAEGGEVAQKKNGALRIFSAQPILGGISPAQAVMRGANKDKVFNAQQQFKRRNHLSDGGGKAKHGTEVPYKRIHINEDGTFTDTLTGKNYNTSATNGEDVVITGKANHWKEAGKKDTSSYFDPMGAVNFVTAAGALILNANPSNVVGSIRDSKNFNDFVRHYMMQDTGGFVNTKWAKEHPYLSLGINTIGDKGLGIGANKAVDILRHPLEYGKYGYKLNKLYKKAGLLNRGEYKTTQENYEKLLDYYTGNRPYDEGAIDYTYEVKARDNAERINPDMFYSYVTPNKVERANFRRVYTKKATDDAFTEMHTPIRYGFNKGIIADYDDLMNHNPEYYKFLEETNLPWNEQSTVDAFLKRQKTSLRGVYADDKETAKKYLTEIQAKRKGGDRLDTNGGLYSSNSTGIADAFKNPDNGVSNGYIGKLHYDFGINRDKPIADQLRQARMKIVRGGKNNVFAGTKYYPQSIKEARKQGAVAIEDNYGRSNGDVLNVTERAYLPGSAKQDKLTLQNLKEYLAQENQRGRWNTSGVDKMKEDEELFIPRQYNRFDDFIREARIFMKPRREYDFNKVSKFQNDVIDRIRSRSKYRNKLIDKSRRLLRRNERNSDNFDIDNTISIMDFDEPFRFGGRIKLRNGGLTPKDKGSSKHQYPSVSSKDFAGGGRSYPIPTKADAVDALRLAGLHGRSDVKAKVYSRYPELRPKSRIGGSWKAPVYNTNKYRVSNRMRRQIATWEGSDFAGQNRRFKGDAIGAKERELRRIMGRTYNYLNDNQRDSLNSIYYNSRVDTFKNAFGKWFRNLNSAVDRGDERAFNNSLAGIRQSMTVGANRKGMSGLAKRRAWERNWFGNPIPIVSNETKAILNQQAEAKMVQPTDNTRVVIQPEYIEVPAPVGHGVVPVDNPDPNLLQGNIKDNLINMGNKFRLGQRCGGSTRMRKALGGESRPVKGMRRKLAWGDVTYPYRRNNNFDYWDIIDQEQKANDKGGISPWTTSNKYDVKVPYAITKSTPTIPYTSQVSTPTSGVSENKTIPTYTGNKSGMIIRDADWYGLGADLVSSIGGSILGLGAYKNLDFDYNLPNFVEESPVALNTTYHNEAQKSNVERNRLNSRNSILRNTMSGSTAVGRMQGVDTNSLYQLNQLADEKTNKETELMNQNLLNEQQVRARNAAARNQYYNTVASIKNAAIQAKNEAELAKGQILSGSLQGIGNSFQNFISQGRQNYDDTQAMLMGVAASDYATPSRLLELGVDVGDDAALAGIYRSAMNIPNPGARPKREDYSDNTEYSYALTRWENQNKAYQRRNSYADLIKGRMSKKNLIKYGII